MIIRMEDWSRDGKDTRICQHSPDAGPEVVRKTVQDLPEEHYVFVQLFASSVETFLLFHRRVPAIKMEFEFRYAPRPLQYFEHAKQFRELARQYIRTSFELAETATSALPFHN